MKQYKTIVRLSNPRGAVMVNEDYQPLGTLRRYETNTVSGGIKFVHNTIKEFKDEFEQLRQVPNMDFEVIKYELFNENKESHKEKKQFKGYVWISHHKYRNKTWNEYSLDGVLIA